MVFFLSCTFVLYLVQYVDRLQTVQWPLILLKEQRQETLTQMFLNMNVCHGFTKIALNFFSFFLFACISGRIGSAFHS